MTHQTETDCPTPETHNWGCGCPTDVLPLHAESGVDTLGCDCGHNGMGAKWHTKTCAWLVTMTVPHPGTVAAESAAVSAAVAPPTQAAPSLRAGLRDEIVKALGRITTVPPVAHRREQADHVLAVLYREWPWLRAEAEDAEPTDRAALRDRIAEALMQWAESNNSPQYGAMRRPATVVQNAYSRADAVLAVLPSAADWDALVREADRLRRDGAALHTRAEELDTQLAALRQQVTKPTDRAAVLPPAATCSAQYHGPGEDQARLCIRAAQHQRTAHTDEHGFHWSDTVATYPVADGTFRTGTNVRAELRRMADETATQTPEEQ